MEEPQIDEIEDSDDFNLEELSEEEESLDFDSEIEDYRDLEDNNVKFKNPTLDIDLTDEHHCTIYIVPDDERTTSQIMTLEEMTEAVGIRVTQIENGAPVFTDVTGYSCPIQMARKELFDGKSPLVLERAMKLTAKTKIVEMWKVNDMTLPISRREQRALTQKQIAEHLGIAPKITTDTLPKSTPAPVKKTPAKTKTPKKK